jgi:multidrug resistance protein, MATE family
MILRKHSKYARNLSGWQNQRQSNLEKPLNNSTSLIKDPPQRPIVIAILFLAIPTILQMSSYTLMQFADTYMLSLVNDKSATAAGQAGGVHFSFISLGFGVLFLVNALVSQNVGKNQPQLCGRVMWQGIYIGLAYGAITASLWLFALPMFLALGHEPELARLEADYLKVLALGGAFKLAATAMTQFLVGVGRPMVVLVSAVCGCLINLFFNWLLIYGNWGFGVMGVAGAAWATVASIFMELLVMIGFLVMSKRIRPFGIGDWQARWDVMREVLKLGVPVGLAMCAEVTAWTLFNVWVIGRFGNDAMAANTYAFRYMLTSFIPMIGLGSAVTALVGRAFGAGDGATIRKVSHVGFAMAAAYMVCWGVAFVIFGESLMGLFTRDANVIALGAGILVFIGAYQLLDAMYVVYGASLRGMSDTIIPSAVMIVMNWLLVVGGAYAVATYWSSLGPRGPWAVMCVYGTIVGVFMLVRTQLMSRRVVKT